MAISIESKTTVTIDGVQYEAERGVIEDTFLGVEDHGVLTATLHFAYGGSGQAFGLRTLDSGRAKGDGGEPLTSYCGWFLRRVIETLDVSRWEDIKRTEAYAIRLEPSGLILGIVDKSAYRYFLPDVEIGILDSK